MRQSLPKCVTTGRVQSGSKGREREGRRTGRFGNLNGEVSGRSRDNVDIKHSDINIIWACCTTFSLTLWLFSSPQFIFLSVRFSCTVFVDLASFGWKIHVRIQVHDSQS